MAQWELISLVFLTVINLSKENCYNYFMKENVKDWGKELELQIPLIKMHNLQDTMMCSAHKTCSQNSSSMPCILADVCSPASVSDKQIADRCDGEYLGTIPFYLFMCLMENALPDVDVNEHCNNVTEYMLRDKLAFDQTPTSPPTPTTATLSKTTAVPTKCAETPPTTTAALPTKPPAVPQPSEVTEKSTGDEMTSSEAKSAQVMTAGNLTLMVVVLVSVVMNVVLVVDKLGRTRQNCRNKCNELYTLNEIPSEVESLSPTNTASPQDQMM